MRRLLWLLAAWSLAAGPAQAAERWAAYYAHELPLSRFAGYEVVAFDSDAYPSLEGRVAGSKPVILGYISTAEAESYRDYYPEIKRRGLLLAKSDLWEGHEMIDIRNPQWEALVLDILIPRILAKGFDGLMLDTIDSALDLEERDPKTYAGMKDAAARLIQAIRERYPHIKLMLNRGFAILPQVAGQLDYVLAESILVNHLPGKETYEFFPSQDTQSLVTQLHEAQALHPGLQVVSLDYWDMSDKQGVKRIYEIQRGHGFIPSVSTLKLNQLFPEPQ